MKTPLPRLLPLFTFHFSLFTAALCAATPPVYTLTPDGSTLRAFLPADPDSPDVSTLDWTNPPPSLDLSSLAVWNVRRPWPLAAVDRLPDGALRFTLAAPLSVHRPPSVTASLPALRATPRHLLSRLPDLPADDPSAPPPALSTHLLLTAPSPDLLPPPGATLLFRDTPAPRRPAPLPGAAGLNLASPIADFWFPPAASRPPRLYPLPADPDSPAPADPAAPLLATLAPSNATLLYVAETLPYPLHRHPLPVRLLLDAPHPPLPPGPVSVGDLRFPPVASIPDHVPADAPVPLDFPTLPTVPPLLLDRDFPVETALPGGATELQFHFRFLPDPDAAAPRLVRLLERPSRPDWTLSRSTAPALPSPPGTLLFEVPVPPEGAAFSYTLRLP